MTDSIRITKETVVPVADEAVRLQVHDAGAAHHQKITLNMGVGEAVTNKKIMEHAVGDMTKIAGQNRS